MGVSRDQAFQQYNDYILGLGGTPNSDTAGDFENLFRQTSDYSVAGGQGLDNPLGSWDQVFSSFQPTLQTRWQRPTLSAGGIGGDLDPNGNGRPGGWVTDNGRAATAAQLDDLIGVLRSMNQQPDVDLSGIQPGDFPVFEVPGEDLSPAIDDTLLDIMEGDPTGLGSVLQTLLQQRAGGGINSQRFQQRAEMAREALTRGEVAALADMRGALAERGFGSLPGSPDGMELDATSRAFEPLQREYLQALRQATIEESELADQGELEALQLATGWSQNEIAARLGAVNSAQERQAMLSDVALRSLEQNRLWNQFLADFGLRREEVAEQIRRGRVDAISPVISMFLALIAQSRGGHI